MEYILLIVFWVQAQGWSVAMAEFGDKDACEAARVIARDSLNATARQQPSGGTAGQTHCIPKHSAPVP